MRRLGLAAILILALMGCGDPAGKALHDGLVNFQQQNYDQAITCYEQAIKLGARSPAAYNMLGLAYRYKNQRLRDPGTPRERNRGLPDGGEDRPQILGGHG